VSTLKHQLVCRYSGLQIGTLEYAVVAGHAPYLSHWNDMIACHPIFSLDRHRLLAFSRSEWNRLAKRSEDGETSEGENNLLRVCFLAMLHSLGSIHQEVPCLPPMHLVQTHMQRLFILSYWHHFLDSKRFHFPEFKINRFNANDRFENIGHYLDACFSRKEDYENGVNEAIEEEKVRSAERALHALRDGWITPVGNKKLWQWILAHMPPKHHADASSWMPAIFLASDRKALDFEVEQIDLLEEIMLAECPPGTGIMKAARERIEYIRRLVKDNKEAFDVDFTEFEEGTDTEIKAPTPEPMQKDFPTKAAFFKAHAQWYLKQRAAEKKSKVANDL
jgi:hypothetical protein